MLPWPFSFLLLFSFSSPSVHRVGPPVEKVRVAPGRRTCEISKSISTPLFGSDLRGATIDIGRTSSSILDGLSSMLVSATQISTNLSRIVPHRFFTAHPNLFVHRSLPIPSAID